MKRAIASSLLAVVSTWAVAPALGQAHVPVEGYRRDDGTYVPPHHRTAPDGDFWNNWSTYPNVNPYSGEVGPRRQPRNRPADAFSDSWSPGVWRTLDARAMLRQKQAQRAAARSRTISQINAMRSRAAEMRAAAPLMRAEQHLLDRQLELERRQLELQERQLRAQENALRMEEARQQAWQEQVQDLLRNLPAPPPVPVPAVRPPPLRSRIPHPSLPPTRQRTSPVPAKARMNRTRQARSAHRCQRRSAG